MSNTKYISYFAWYPTLLLAVKHWNKYVEAFEMGMHLSKVEVSKSRHQSWGTAKALTYPKNISTVITKIPPDKCVTGRWRGSLDQLLFFFYHIVCSRNWIGKIVSQVDGPFSSQISMYSTWELISSICLSTSVWSWLVLKIRPNYSETVLILIGIPSFSRSKRPLTVGSGVAQPLITRKLFYYVPRGDKSYSVQLFRAIFVWFCSLQKIGWVHQGTNAFLLKSSNGAELEAPEQI